MGTSIRAEISSKNKYWISKHRHYELKHFCLQYPEWKKVYKSLDDASLSSTSFDNIPSGNGIKDITARCAIDKAYYGEKLQMIEDAAKEADKDLWIYILMGVTEEVSFTYLQTKLEIPCGRDMYYDRYRKFFWILDKMRK